MAFPTPPQKINWIWIYNGLGIAAIVVLGVFVLRLVGRVDSFDNDPLRLSIQQISPPRAYHQMQSDADTVLVDVRSPVEWEVSDHAVGATLLPWEEFEARALAELDRNSTIILICQAGNVRSMQAAQWLVAQGYPSVYNLDGGMVSWVQQNMPVEPATTESAGVQ